MERNGTSFWTIFLAVLLAGTVLGGGALVFWGLTDDDGDGVPRWSDRCPDKAGVEALHGCPLISTVP